MKTASLIRNIVRLRWTEVNDLEWQLFVIIEVEVFAHSLYINCLTVSERIGYSNLREERIVFRVINLFVLNWYFKITLLCAFSNAWMQWFSLNNRFHFRFVSWQTLPYALRTLGIWNELHGIILWHLKPFCKMIEEVYSSLRHLFWEIRENKG